MFFRGPQTPPPPNRSTQEREYPFHVYLSHAHEDFLVVERLWHALEGIGLRAYMYEHYPHPGRSVESAVIGALNDSAEIISFLTDAGAGAAWVHQELGAALALGKTIVPVIDVATVQVPGFTPMLTPIHYSPKKPEATLGELLCLLRADFNRMDADISVQCPTCLAHQRVVLPNIPDTRTAMSDEKPIGPHQCRSCPENLFLSPFTFEAMSQQLALGRAWSE